MGCCEVPILDAVDGGQAMEVQLRWINGRNHSQDTLLPVHVFVAQIGWFDNWEAMELLHERQGKVEVPLDLNWKVTEGLAPPRPRSEEDADPWSCAVDVARKLCKSEFSGCQQEMGGGYICYCQKGYDGNPYLAGGCQDIDECKLPKEEIECFGECTNTIGSYHCRCPGGFHGNHTLPNGCVRSVTGLTIGMSVASGLALLLLVLGVILTLRKIKQLRVKRLKQKFFKQNRGQLLQQLVSQRADTAEKMVIPVDELAKATNNFDKARELGGGGHGTVYKGILSDLHVVAINKSKIAVQKEIDEFINEVAILSQINHRYVVRLFGCCLETEVPLLVYEFISNGTLYHHLHVEGSRSLSWANRLRIGTEIAIALVYLHSSVSIPIIHRDIKSTNILLDDTLTSKVSDFGASRYIPKDKTGLTTRVQGTIGYLDPMYFYTGRLTEKSDVYSFGVILIELLTRKKPSSYLSPEGDGLVAHFSNLLVEGNLVEILDPQVKEEGDKEIQEVAELAASCVKLSSEDRPTMRQVEHKLEGLRASMKHLKDNMVAEEFEEDGSILMNCPSTNEMQSMRESSRRYSMEEDISMSARYPR
ncbi:hypothetical protein ACP70R_044654 [Stipagrostis hirtigluma subsp. patula]